MNRKNGFSAKREAGGFTLVEVLVVIAITAIMGMILTEIFIRSLQGGNKAEVLGLLKQNGQSVLENIDKTIRSSDNVICIDSPGDILTVEKEGIYTRYRFVSEQIVEDHPVLPANVSQVQFLQDICTNINYDQMLPSFLTDLQKIKVSPPQNGKIFTNTKSSGFKAVVTVSFLLKPGDSIPKTVSEQIDPVPFATTIQLR